MLRHPHSTQNELCVHSLVGSKRFVFLWKDSIVTTSKMAKALESVSSGEAHPMELLCIKSR